MADILRDPIWQGVGAIITLIVGVFGFYYAEKNRVWLIIAGVIVILIAGIAIGTSIGTTDNDKDQLLAIEGISQRVFAYHGNAENLGGLAKLHVIFDGFENNPYYELSYDIPANQAGYAGIAFQFQNGLNVSAYKTIVFEIQFDEIDNAVDFYVKDIGGKKDSIRIVSKDTNKLILRYEFGNFPNVNFNALLEIGLNVQDTFSNGHHTVTIHLIGFEK